MKGAEKDIEALQFNTVIAKMMEFVNELSSSQGLSKKGSMEWFVQVLALFAPHFGEELWEHWGGRGRSLTRPSPPPTLKLLVDDVVTYVIQVDGKVRGRLELPKDRPEQEVSGMALAHPNVAKFLEGRTIAKTIVVPNKLLNIVTKT